MNDQRRRPAGARPQRSRRERFRDEAGGSAAPWLYGIARNVLLMTLRRSAGTHWRCYAGREAVRQQIIGTSLLGQVSPGPGAG